ncbi:MAG: hypothetical protein M1827_003768 [Pycnora praestabilis]|nr:MAG: hypothetical protein M1827_003768 [Pycnora praestabilis]
MSELEAVLTRLGIPQYLDRFTRAGYDSWKAVLGITEEDLDRLKLKLGHRRKLQQEVARARSLLKNSSSPNETGSTLREDRRAKEEDEDEGESTTYRADDQGGSRKKRKYIRRPKTDGNAPERPPSAYVLFSNGVRRELQGQNVSFVNIAKMVGERWQAISPEEKEYWQSQASAAKELHDTEFAEYRKTDDYKQYMSYLADFEKKNPRAKAVESRSPQAQQSGSSRGHMDEGKSLADRITKSFYPLETMTGGLNTLREPHFANNWQEILVESIQHLLVESSQTESASNIIARDAVLNQDFDKSGQDQNRHSVLINPFQMLPISTLAPFLEVFLQRVNCIFYFFDSDELEGMFREAFASPPDLTNETKSVVCLVIALGVQMSDHGSEDEWILWYENGRRFLDDENWSNDLWIVRALALVSMYHVGERRDTSRNYLEIAKRIGNVNGLAGHDNPTWQMKDPERDKWLRVWRTVMFLHDWLALASKANERSTLADHSIALEPDSLSRRGMGFEQVSQRYIGRLCTILAYVPPSGATVPVVDYERYVDELRSFPKHFPEEFQDLKLPQHVDGELRSFLPNISESHKTMITHDKLWEQYPTRVNVEEFAHTCIQSASDLAQLCAEMSRARAFTPNSWLPKFFLLNASVASVVGLVWQKQQHRLGRALLSDQSAQRASSTIDVALEILGYCRLRSKSALWSWSVLTQMKRWIEQSNWDDSILLMERGGGGWDRGGGDPGGGDRLLGDLGGLMTMPDNHPWG